MGEKKRMGMGRIEEQKRGGNRRGMRKKMSMGENERIRNECGEEDG
jgi:hypothetical protein